MLDRGEKRAILWGALIGAASGSLLAVLYRRWRRQRHTEGTRPIKTREVIRLGVSLASVMRQFLQLIS
jgi:predicted membrane protein